VLLCDRNPNVLSAVFALGPMAVPEVSTRIKMAQTSNVVAVVEADGRFFAAQREIKITIGGCVG
jgi:sulfur-oxidizing protein SoxY